MAKTEMFSQDMLDSLTEEERAGLLDPEFIDEGDTSDAAAQAAVEGTAAEDAVDAPAAEGATAEVAAADASTAAETDPPAKTPAEEPAERETSAADSAAKASVLPDWQLPADHKERLERIEADEATLEKRFDDGELSGAEYRAQLRTLGSERAELDRAQLKAEMAAESREHDLATRKSTWFESTVPDWLAKHTNYEAGTAAYDALNAEVMRLQAATKGDPFAASILEDAHAKVQRDLRKALGLPDETPAPVVTEKKPASPAKELPPALGGLPNAAPADLEDTSKFAMISRMKGVDREEAMASLSPAEMDAYLASPYV